MLAAGPVMAVAGGDTLLRHQRLAFGGHDIEPLKHRLGALEKFRAFVLWLVSVDPVVWLRACD